MSHRHPTAALNWKGFVLLLIAVVSIVAGLLWMWWPPQPAGPGPGPAPAPAPGPGPDGGTRPLGTDSGDAIAGSGGVPVRVLVLNMTANTGSVELCDVPTTTVVIRWYADSPPSGPVLEQKKITVTGGSGTFALKPGLFPTAQSIQPNGQPIGKEVAPGQTGNCP